MNTTHLAEALAADLAGAQVDPNEAQKALAYLRRVRNGREFFSYLQAIVNNGSVVIRSGRTLGYYRDLLTICQRHIRSLQDDYPRFVETFAWSLRLLRYYRTVPWAAEEKAASQRGQHTTEQPLIVSSTTPIPSQTTSLKLPGVGDVFTGEVLDLDDEVVKVAIPGFSSDKAIGAIEASITARPKYRIGNSARVEVIGIRTQKNGRNILELKPAPKQSK